MGRTQHFAAPSVGKSGFSTVWASLVSGFRRVQGLWISFFRACVFPPSRGVHTAGIGWYVRQEEVCRDTVPAVVRCILGGSWVVASIGRAISVGFMRL